VPEHPTLLYALVLTIRLTETSPCNTPSPTTSDDDFHDKNGDRIWSEERQIIPRTEIEISKIRDERLVIKMGYLLLGETRESKKS